MPIPDLKEYIQLIAEQVISADLPPPSPLNIEQQFRVGNVLFDTIKGMGAVPNNQNVNYLGFTAFMRPTDFRRLCYADDRSQTARGIAEAIRQGHPIGTPFLNLEVNIEEFNDGKPLNVYVRGHEGRGRADAFTIINGADTFMPVNCFLNNFVK